ncbi:MAG: hypothetical protein NC489_27690 [Ruminococcus flavefaciens]|nr:hypothetical protein [Ruminococcus flavefaciens]
MKECTYAEQKFYRSDIKLLRFLKSADSVYMPESAKLIRQSLADGTYCRHGNFTKREVSEILDIRIVEEQNGTGVSLVCDNGVEYRFAANDESHSDYDTPQKLLQAAIWYSQNHDAKTTLNFISRQSVHYYEGILRKEET